MTRPSLDLQRLSNPRTTLFCILAYAMHKAVGFGIGMHYIKNSYSFKSRFSVQFDVMNSMKDLFLFRSESVKRILSKRSLHPAKCEVVYYTTYYSTYIVKYRLIGSLHSQCIV